MSEYLRQRGALTKNQKWIASYSKEVNARQMQIDIISDFMNGYEGVHSKNRWKTSSSRMSDEEWYSTFITFNYMKKIIGELKILAPSKSLQT